ncbi:hypothetical protein ACS0TY_026918 [Phlomoides rotata]
MLVVKVINSNTMLQKGVAVSPLLRNTRIAECLIGDDTASILFTTRNDQDEKAESMGTHVRWWRWPDKTASSSIGNASTMVAAAKRMLEWWWRPDEMAASWSSMGTQSISK